MSNIIEKCCEVDIRSWIQTCVTKVSSFSVPRLVFSLLIELETTKGFLRCSVSHTDGEVELSLRHSWTWTTPRDDFVTNTSILGSVTSWAENRSLTHKLNKVELHLPKPKNITHQFSKKKLDLLKTVFIWRALPLLHKTPTALLQHFFERILQSKKKSQIHVAAISLDSAERHLHRQTELISQSWISMRLNSSADLRNSVWEI